MDRIRIGREDDTQMGGIYRRLVPINSLFISLYGKHIGMASSSSHFVACYMYRSPLKLWGLQRYISLR